MTYSRSDNLLTVINGRLEEINRVMLSECKKTTTRLKSASPKATGELSNKWTVTGTVTKVFGLTNVTIYLTNKSNAATYRIIGRSPGVMPPVAAIRQWCTVKGIDPVFAYPIARSIGLKGTKRWQTESNVLNYKRSVNEYAIPNEWTITIDNIIKRCQQL